MKRRRLSSEDLDLWRRVAERTERLDLGRTRIPTPKPNPAEPIPGQDRQPTPAILPPPAYVPPAQPAFGHDLALPLAERFRKSPVRMDQKAFGRMKRGKLAPEGRIDLHGMTLERAHPVLTRFILTAHASGKRLVLVITGKGKKRDDGGPIPVRHGVLRHQVPQWLSMPPLSSAVLQISEAHISHGGGGAYYVYLRRNR